MSNPVDDRGNVKVDFVWGNMPMQPDDARGENTLDPALDSHIIATSGYEGFPAFITGAPYDDTIANVTVPNVVGLTEAAATTALTNAGLTKGAVTTTTAGAVFNITGVVATEGPDTVELTVGSHTVTSGESVDVTITTTDGGWNTVSGTKTVTAVTATTITFVDSAVSSNDTRALAGTVVRTSVVGKVKTQTPAAGTLKNAGTAVALVKYAAS